VGFSDLAGQAIRDLEQVLGLTAIIVPRCLKGVDKFRESVVSPR
jgi:hypothetical protein